MDICMLAENYYDTDRKPRYSIVNSNWVMSEKYDGQRALWTGDMLISRNGTPILTPDWFSDILKSSSCKLDGELYFGRGKFNMTGIFRASRVDDDAWKKVSYLVFDIPDDRLSSTLTQRMDILRENIRILKCSWTKEWDFPIKLVDYFPIRNKTHLTEFFESVVRIGGEGVILRNPYSLYEFGRSKHILKMKPCEDMEAVIEGYNEGNGRLAGMLGSFTVHALSSPKIKFNVSGLNDAIRRNYLKTHPIGTVIVVTFTERTSTGKPRFPRYKGIRTDPPTAPQINTPPKPKPKLIITKKNISL